LLMKLVEVLQVAIESLFHFSYVSLKSERPT